MQGLSGQIALRGSFLALHVQGNPRGDVWSGPNTIYGLLHLAVTAVPTFHRVGCGRQTSKVRNPSKSDKAVNAKRDISVNRLLLGS